jgi:hypothetical protein
LAGAQILMLRCDLTIWSMDDILTYVHEPYGEYGTTQILLS